MKSKDLQHNKVLLRLEKGEDVVSSLRKFALDYDMAFFQISAIGAVENVNLSYYNVKTKKYQDKIFPNKYELTSLSGNLSCLNGQPSVHLHCTLSDDKFEVIGGHLNEARVSLTVEIIAEKLTNDIIDRKYDDETGLNLLDV